MNPRQFAEFKNFVAERAKIQLDGEGGVRAILRHSCDMAVEMFGLDKGNAHSIAPQTT